MFDLDLDLDLDLRTPPQNKIETPKEKVGNTARRIVSWRGWGGVGAGVSNGRADGEGSQPGEKCCVGRCVGNGRARQMVGKLDGTEVKGEFGGEYKYSHISMIVRQWHTFF